MAKFDTLALHAGYNSADHNHSVQVPIYATTAYDLVDTDRADRLFAFSENAPLYSRVTNPTVAVLEERVAALDGGIASLAVASGMSAISIAILNAAEKGTVLTSRYLYGGSADSFLRIYEPLGITIKPTDAIYDTDKLDAEITDDVKAIYFETISNPNAVIADIEKIAEIAHKKGVAVIVDNTFATPYLLQPIKHGADVVIYSATKALSGHGNIIGGIIVDSNKFNWANGRYPQFERKEYTIRDRKTGKNRSFHEAFPHVPFVFRSRLVWLNYFGAALSPFDAYLAIIGIETLSERLKKQTETAVKLVEWFEGNPNVEWVKYPTAKTTTAEQKALFAKYLPKGAGGVFTFGFKGTEAEQNKFLNSLKLLSYHVNVGDAKTLISNTAKTTHSELVADNQALADILPNTLRISTGLEDLDDIIADLEQAFAAAK